MVETGDKGILFPLGNKKENSVVMGAETPEVSDKVVVVPLGNIKKNLVAWKPGAPEVGDKALLLPVYGMKYPLAIKEEGEEEEDCMKEGNYTSWTHKWTFNLPDGLNSEVYMSAHIDDKNDVLHLYWYDGSNKNRYGIYNLADFSVVFESPTGSDYLSGYPTGEYSRTPQRSWTNLVDAGASISCQTYLLLLRADYDTIEVWRGGATALWSRDTSNEVAGTYIAYGMISITGKWIVIITGETGNQKLICYEGS